MGFEKTPIFLVVVLVLVSLDLCFGSGSGMSPAHVNHGHHHHCDHGHGRGHDHHHHQHRQVEEERKKMMLPEELAEEEDMKLYGFGSYRDEHGHNNDHHELSGLALFGLFNGPLVTCIGMFALSKLGFPYLPDYFTCDIYTRKTIQDSC
ncbi:hypothetical protein V6N13_035690 [Hibiscus sabdariffa]